LFEEDMKNESRCPLDANECGNIRDPSRDCEFIPCDEEEDGGGLVCTDDEFECSDGIFVPRNPDNNCAFEPCPRVDTNDATRAPTFAPVDVTHAPTDAAVEDDEGMTNTGMPTTPSIPKTDMGTSTPTALPTWKPSMRASSALSDKATSAAVGAFFDSKVSVAVKAACFIFYNLLAM